MSAVASLQNDNIRFGYRQYQAPMLAAFRPHAHDLWEILYVPGGNAFCMIEGRRYRLSGPTLILHRPARIHRIQVEGDTVYEHYSLMCDADTLFPDMVRQIPADVELIRLPAQSSVEALFREMRLHYEQSFESCYKNVFPALIEDLFRKILTAIEEGQSQESISEDATVRLATAYISKHIIALESVEELCTALGVTKKRLYDLFIRHMLLAPKRYIQVKRLALVQMALRSCTNPKTLLMQYGFRDYEAFRSAYYRFYTEEP
jgi:AraC-like DNA-binding protein